MSSKLIGIVGNTGTGKSTAIKFLDSKETYIISVAKKELPFQGAEKLYNLDNRNYKEVDDVNEIIRLLRTISEKATHIKNIVLDDANYLMGFNMVEKAMEKGYEKWSLIAKDMVEDSGEIIGYKIKTAGKLIDNQIVLEGLFTICLYTYVEEKKDDSTEYSFITNRYRKFPAKSPNGLFNEIKIPNNLQIVVDAINEYYK